MHGREHYLIMHAVHYNRALIFFVMLLILIAHDIHGPAMWLNIFIAVRSFVKCALYYRMYIRGDDL